MNLTNSSVPKAVIFDLGKVLLDFDYGLAANALAANCEVSADGLRALLDQSPLLHRYESGSITTAEFFSEFVARSSYTGTLSAFWAAFGDIFTEIAPMIALHRQLVSGGMPTFIFSNTNEIAVGHVRAKFPFFAGFSGYVFSHEVGCMKPGPKIYEAVEAVTGLRGPDLLYIDDRAENIEAGDRRGWQTILHHDPAATVPMVSSCLRFPR